MSEIGDRLETWAEDNVEYEIQRRLSLALRGATPESFRDGELFRPADLPSCDCMVGMTDGFDEELERILSALVILKTKERLLENLPYLEAGVINLPEGSVTEWRPLQNFDGIIPGGVLLFGFRVESTSPLRDLLKECERKGLVVAVRACIGSKTIEGLGFPERVTRCQYNIRGLYGWTSLTIRDSDAPEQIGVLK